MWLRNTFKKRIFIINGRKDKKHYVLINDFNTFMYDHTVINLYFLLFFGGGVSPLNFHEGKWYYMFTEQFLKNNVFLIFFYKIL